MSRRTKLFITFFLALLLAVPVVYLVLSWRPENPLRVRTLTVAELLESTSHQPRSQFEPALTPVILENTSTVPIHLYAICEGERFQSDGWTAYAPLASTPSKPTSQELAFLRTLPATIVPAHGSLRVDVLHISPTLPRPAEHVFCISASGVKHRTLLMLDWCRERTPESLRSLVPQIEPDYHPLPVHPPALPAAGTVEISAPKP